MSTRNLRGTCAVIFHTDGGDDFGQDKITPVAYTLGVVVSQTRDGRTIKSIEDSHGHRHRPTRHTYRVPELCPCAMLAVAHTGLPEQASVDEVRRLIREMVHLWVYRRAVIAHDLDRTCPCSGRGWRR
jgi:hypothetical protein